MTDLPADLPPPPERPVLPAGDAKTILVDRVREALIALPGREQPGRNLQSGVARCHPSRYDGHISKEAPPEQQLRRGQQPGKDPDQ